MDKSEIGRAMQALRQNRRGGGAKPRTVQHDPTIPRCLCVDCRKARGQYPSHLLEKPVKSAEKPSKPKKRA